MIACAGTWVVFTPLDRAGRIPIVKLALLADGVHAVLFQIGQHARNHGRRLGVGLEQTLFTLLEYFHSATLQPFS